MQPGVAHLQFLSCFQLLQLLCHQHFLPYFTFDLEHLSNYPPSSLFDIIAARSDHLLACWLCCCRLCFIVCYSGVYLLFMPSQELLKKKEFDHSHASSQPSCYYLPHVDSDSNFICQRSHLLDHFLCLYFAVYPFACCYCYCFVGHLAITSNSYYLCCYYCLFW